MLKYYAQVNINDLYENQICLTEFDPVEVMGKITPVLVIILGADGTLYTMFCEKDAYEELKEEMERR